MLALVIVFPLVTRSQTEPGYSTPILEPASPDGVALVVIPPAPTVQDVVQYEFRDIPVMVRIANAESSFDPSAKNASSTATGLFQIVKGTWALYGCTGERTNAQDNIACAKKIYASEGTAPWVSSQDKWGNS